mmetsp:Transcript_27058/g.55370  ORF Transcript_27058/g.55370 Transcript_27058/m.55370 type:complete len:90 (+) Transcript_27058:316-585(+)
MGRNRFGWTKVLLFQNMASYPWGAEGRLGLNMDNARPLVTRKEAPGTLQGTHILSQWLSTLVRGNHFLPSLISICVLFKASKTANNFFL